MDEHSPNQTKKKNSTLPNNFRDKPPNLLDFKSSRSHSGAASSSSSHLLSPVDIPEGRGVVTVSPGFKRKFHRGHKKASSLGSKYVQTLMCVYVSGGCQPCTCVCGGGGEKTACVGTRYVWRLCLQVFQGPGYPRVYYVMVRV